MTAKIKLNAASGGGSISIQAPSSSSNNRVISLPDIADGTLLTSQSSIDSTKLSPAIVGGKVLQVLQTVITAQQNYGTGAENEIMNVSITPSASTSKVLVCCNMASCFTNSVTTEIRLLIYRDSTEITGLLRYFRTTDTNDRGQPSGMFLDSPNSTSSITYRLKAMRVAGSDGYVINASNGQAKSSLTVMEIAA